MQFTVAELPQATVYAHASCVLALCTLQITGCRAL